MDGERIMIDKEKLVYYIDIDGIIFENDSSRIDYYNVKPIQENIDKINRLYDEGNCIILWTSRGSITGIDWRDYTVKQLYDARVRYHKVKFNKPYYDVFIDDRASNEIDTDNPHHDRTGEISGE